MRALARLREIGLRRRALRKRIRTSDLSPEDQADLLILIRTVAWLCRALQKKTVTVERLKRLFASKTESSAKILGQIHREADLAEAASIAHAPESGTPGNVVPIGKKPRKKGHGRLGAKAYASAKKIEVPHESLKAGDTCPKCARGRVYWHTAGRFLKLVGQAAVQAVVYFQHKVRCNACGAIFAARLPAGIADSPVATASARAIVALLRFGAGMPHWRLAKLQRSLGVPLPPSTQWDMVKGLFEESVHPVWKCLLRLAAQGEVIHNDDTTAKVLELRKQIEIEQEKEKIQSHKRRRNDQGELRSIHATGILSKVGNHRILLLFTGRLHAGDNLARLLSLREPGIPPPIQMADMLTANEPKGKKTVRAGCLGHGRRGFVDCFTAFREQCTHAILEFKLVFKNDALAREAGMTWEERLVFHQNHSGPVLARLKLWFERQFDDKIVEPNSELGKTIGYMLDHWSPLTLFLRVPGAPLTNDDLEREFKPAQSHLKNSLFYKTAGGALVGDATMSLIQTCILNDENPFEYLVAIQDHARAVNESPEKWLPWNWRQNLETPAKQAATA